MLILYLYKLIGKTEEPKGRLDLIVDGYMVYKVLNKIKEIISIEKFDDNKILINTDDKLSNNITLTRFMILMTCFLKDGNTFDPQRFLDDSLYDYYTPLKSCKKDEAKNKCL